jgi:putative sugar O-methyltransferase
MFRRKSDTRAVLDRSAEMAAWLDTREPIFRLSRFWTHYAARQTDLLAKGGIENFKRSLPQNYFTWPISDVDDPQFRALLRSWAEEPSLIPISAKRRGDARVRTADAEYLATTLEQDIYAFFVALLWHHATTCDPDNLMARIAEPAVGNPVPIYLDETLISQDLANSIREYQIFRDHLPKDRNAVLAEIGAGYGRLGYVATIASRCRYWIVDVPPALAVAEWYLSSVLSDKRVFRWRPFALWGDIANELAQADIAFFTIDQLALFPERAVDVFASVSVIHEMTPAQIETYMRLQFRAAARAVYTKNWTSWFNEIDQHRFDSAHLTPPSGWTTVLDAPDDVLAAFTQKLFVRESA